jgi:aspartate kinase
MALIVQKYGGNLRPSHHRKDKDLRETGWRNPGRGHDVVVVVSAMSGETNRLLGLAHQIARYRTSGSSTSSPRRRAGDDRIALRSRFRRWDTQGEDRSAVPDHHRTDDGTVKARSRTIEGGHDPRSAGEGYIAVVAGSRGIDDTGIDHDARGGGSDTSAVPRRRRPEGGTSARSTRRRRRLTRPTPTSGSDAQEARQTPTMEMLELASLGAKVLQIRFAVEFGIRIYRGADPRPLPRSTITRARSLPPEDEIMETAVVSGVAHTARTRRRSRS